MITLGFVNDKPTTSSSVFTPINIRVEESYNSSLCENKYGANRDSGGVTKAAISLEFDAMADTDVINMRTILQDRVYSKKVFMNETSQAINATSLILDAGVTASSGYNLSDNVIGDITTFSSAEAATINQIDSDYFENSQATNDYTYLVFNFDITTFISTYGVNAIDRLTLFLHNPYCVRVDGDDSVYGEGYRILAYNGVSYVEIAEQSWTMQDSTLRGSNLMNQQYFSIKKVADFTNIYSSININYVRFLMVNKNPRLADNTLKMGLNCVGLFINGYGVKQTNVDNWTARDPYILSGSTATIDLGEL